MRVYESQRGLLNKLFFSRIHYLKGFSREDIFKVGTLNLIFIMVGENIFEVNNLELIYILAG